MKQKIKKKKKFKLKIKNPKRLLIFLSIIIILFLLLFLKNKEHIKQKKYISLIVNNEDITSKLENEIIIKDGIEYLSFEDVKKCLDENIFQEDEKIITTSERKVSVLQLNNNKIEINGSSVSILGSAFKTERGIIYLPISQMQNSYDIDFYYNLEYSNIVIDNFSKKIEKATLKKAASVKEKMSNSSLTLEKLSKDNTVVFVSEEKGWAKVKTSNGNLGYLKKKVLKNFVLERDEMISDEITEEPKYKKNITNSNIKKYKNRKKIIQEIIEEVVNKKYNSIKIIYSKENETDSFKRFKLEASAMLKECGVTVVYER